VDRRRLLLVGSGGAAGATLRWALLDLGGDSFRPVLLAVNVLGCLVLGVAIAREGPAGTSGHRWLHDALAVGFCGGLTTFSTLAVEVAELGRDGQAGFAAWYLGTSVVLGLAAVLFGAAFAGRPLALEDPLEGEP
jgi:CrcB protein